MKKSNNRCTFVGTIIGGILESYEELGEKFHAYQIGIPGVNGTIHCLPIIIGEAICTPDEIKLKHVIRVIGEIRTRQGYRNGKSKTIVKVFATKIDVPTFMDPETGANNIVSLYGSVYETPFYKETSSGEEITNLVLRVIRADGKIDYIPCRAEGNNAQELRYLSAGDNVEFFGQFQSRNYTKRIPGKDSIEKTAYEILILAITDIRG